MWRKEKITRSDTSVIELDIDFRLLDKLTEDDRKFIMNYILEGYTDLFKQSFKLVNSTITMKTEKLICDEQFLREIAEKLRENLKMFNMVKSYLEIFK